MTENKDACVLLFVKYPEKGSVKLRLCKDVNPDDVLELYRCFVEDTLSMIQKMNLPFFICFHPPGYGNEFQGWLGTAHQFVPQKGTDLGERMKNGFIEVFSRGYQNVLLMGSDSPDLPDAYLKQAFTLLRTKDAVLGPTVDGGYYLIGFRSTTFHPGVFEEIPWSTPQVFQETTKKLHQMRCSVGLLPVWSDIDTVSDLRTLLSRSRNTPFISSNTMTYLQSHQICLENDDEGKTRTKPAT